MFNSRRNRRYSESYQEENGDKAIVINIYKAVVRSRAGQYAVAQMFTDSHHSDNIALFFSLCIRSSALPPKEIVCDMGKALLSGIAKAFTEYLTIESYANVLKFPNYLTQCYIRINVAHFRHLYTLVILFWRHILLIA